MYLQCKNDDHVDVAKRVQDLTFQPYNYNTGKLLVVKRVWNVAVAGNNIEAATAAAL